MKYKPKVKLLTYWMLNTSMQNHLRYETELPDWYISGGIWCVMDVTEEDEKQKRVYTMVCVTSNDPRIKVGDKIKMDEIMIIEFCDRITMVRTKYKSIMERGIKK
jgi:hypothetical protein